MTTPVHPARSPKTERWLDELGADWTFDADLPMRRIDQAGSLANQVRHLALDHEVVKRYAADMAQGDTFPAVLVDAGTGALLGGNHRHAARAEAGFATIAAYLVTAKPLVALRIRVGDNRNHGLPTTEAERLDHGVALVEAGMRQVDAAREVGISQVKLSQHQALTKVGERADTLGVDPAFHRLSRFARLALSRIDDDTVFTAAADMAAETSLPIGDLRQVVDAVLSVEPTEALRLVASEAADHEDRSSDRAGNTRATSRSPRARLDTALAAIKGLTPEAIYDACPNDDVRAVLATRIMEGAAVLAPTVRLLRGDVPR